MNTPGNSSDRDDDDFNIDDLGEALDPVIRGEQARNLSDSELLRAYKTLHSTVIVDTVWLPVLEAEIIRRGLRRLS